MFPPSQNTNLDIEALSGICGSISIACWVVVFSPQIVENFRRRSADGLSVVFIVVWLLGDVFNILGAVLQGVLPTMIILAVYYTLADIVLLAQFFYYQGFTLTDKVERSTTSCPADAEGGHATERTALLSSANGTSSLNGSGNGTPQSNGHANGSPAPPIERIPSHSSFRERFLSIDGTHLSPANPYIPPEAPKPSLSASQSTPPSTLRTIAINLSSILLVCLAGILGWWFSPSSRRSSPSDGQQPPPRQEPEILHFNLWGQIFGYICAVLYLGSRVPQLLLNYRRKSTEGISMLFFLFACIGNLTYVLSIFAYSPSCFHPENAHDPFACAPGEGARVYGRYIAVNLSWLVGSFGTLLLDLGVFVQFFIYGSGEGGASEVGSVDEENSGDEEPVVVRHGRGGRRVSFAEEDG